MLLLVHKIRVIKVLISRIYKYEFQIEDSDYICLTHSRDRYIGEHSERVNLRKTKPIYFRSR